MDLLNRANSAIMELIEYEHDQGRCAATQVLLVQQPERYSPIGYVPAYNDTWERAFQMREH
jgi:hypothetical protein